MHKYLSIWKFLVSRESTCVVVWISSWTKHCFYLKKWLTSFVYPNIQHTFPWKSAYDFKEKKTNKPVFITSYRVWVFKQKSGFGKIGICHHELNSVSGFKNFSDEIGGAISEHDFLILCNKMCQHLEVLHKSRSNNF